MSTAFVDLVNADEHRIQEIDAWPLFRQMKEDAERHRDTQRRRTPGAEYIPPHYRDYVFCLQVADKNGELADRYYYNTPASEVYLRWALRCAADYVHEPD